MDGVVTHGSWVGVVRQVVSNIHLKFPDGSACKMADRHADSLEDVNDTDKDPVGVQTQALGSIFVRTFFVQNGKCSPLLELTPTL